MVKYTVLYKESTGIGMVRLGSFFLFLDVAGRPSIYLIGSGCSWPDLELDGTSDWHLSTDCTVYKNSQILKLLGHGRSYRRRLGYSNM